MELAGHCAVVMPWGMDEPRLTRGTPRLSSRGRERPVHHGWHWAAASSIRAGGDRYPALPPSRRQIGLMVVIPAQLK